MPVTPTSSSSCSIAAPTRTPPQPASPRFMRRSCGATKRWWRALLAHGADPNAPLQTWTPTRRSSKDFNFAPELVGATPFWLAARFTEPDVMRLLAKHAPLDVRAPRRIRRLEPVEPRTQVTTPLMAATGMGGGVAWVQPDLGTARGADARSRQAGRRSGRRLNAANTDGRTALDAATAFHLRDGRQVPSRKEPPGVKKN